MAWGDTAMVHTTTVPEPNDLFRRWRVLEIEANALCEMFKWSGLDVHEVTGHALPPDATVVGIDHDFVRRVFRVSLVSSEWSPVAHGQIAPTLTPPAFTRYTGEKAIVRRLREIEVDMATKRLGEAV